VLSLADICKPWHHFVSGIFRLEFPDVHDRRKEIHFNVTVNPTAQWTAQQITEAFPWNRAPKYLLRDRDKIFVNVFQNRVKALRIEEVLTALL